MTTQTQQKRRCYTPLASLSRRLLSLRRFYQCGYFNLQCLCQLFKRISSWQSLAILDSTNGVNIDICPDRQISLCHQTAFAYLTQAKSCANWSLSWSAHTAVVSSQCNVDKCDPNIFGAFIKIVNQLTRNIKLAYLVYVHLP